MIPITEYAGRDVAVFGLGRTGLSAARALTAGGATVHAWDDNEETRAKAEAAGVTLSDINKRDWQNFAALVLSPGVPYKFPQPHRIVRMAEMSGIPIVGDMELFARAVNNLPDRARPKVVGITGTNGKSTTTALIGHILSEAGRDARVGGNIGKGVLDMEPLNANSIYVLELSSYQLDLIDSLHCDVGVFLNLTPDHLDRHGDLDGYMEAKKRLFRNQTSSDYAVIGVDSLQTESLSMSLSNNTPVRVVQVSSEYALGRGISAINGRLYDSLSGKAVSVGDLQNVTSLPGRHNHQNAAAAFATCRMLGVPADAIMEAIASFPGLPHRLETVGEIGGVRFINDSKATNAQATEQALKSYSRVYWIAGGKAKFDGIDALEPLFPNVAKAYLIGDAQDKFEATLKGKAPAAKCGTLEVAMTQALKDARESGDPSPIILLSPACASFDQFKDFEARGDAFKAVFVDLSGKDALLEQA
ncbi:MAG: UDP-N-acetylmuramoyl-L-alanine--D-glutamate ligase [Hyphomonadaceae bacterium]